MNTERKYQASAPKTIPLTEQAFAKTGDTSVYWLTSAGILINSHGTTIMIDPNLAVRSIEPPISEVDDCGVIGLELLALPPILAKEVKQLDAVLLTHADPDHLGVQTVVDLLPSGVTYHCQAFAAQKLIRLGVPEERIAVHPTGGRFEINGIEVEMTPAYHPCTKEGYTYTVDDCCGFKVTTPNGIIWDPGDTAFLEDHLKNTDVDLLFVDLSFDSIYHMQRQDALRLCNETMPRADLIMFHWGTFYGPEFNCFNADPDDVRHLIMDAERFLEPHPGQKVVVRSKAAQSLC